MYANLNDAACTNPILSKGDTQIWYVKNEFHRAFCMGLQFAEADGFIFDSKCPGATHELVGYVTDAEKEDLFDALQGENWSPEGEARHLIRKLDVHTSMSVGDIVIQHGIVYMVENFGFNAI